MKPRAPEISGGSAASAGAEAESGAAMAVRAFLAEAQAAPAPPSDAAAQRPRALRAAEAIESAARGLLAEKPAIIPDIEARTGFSPREAERSLEGALAPLRAADLMALWEEEIGAPFAAGRRVASPKLAVVFAGGVIAQPGVQALAAAMMRAPFALYRASAGDPGIAARLADGVGKLLAPMVRALAARWERSDTALTADVLAAANAFTAFGEDASLAALAPLLRADASQSLYGSRISFGLMDLSGGVSRDALARAAAALAEDVAAYDQRGCLSPTVVYSIGGGADAFDAWGRALAESFAARGERFGFARRIPGGAAAAIHSLRALWAMDLSGAREAIASPGTPPGWTLLIDRADARLRPSPSFQTLFVIPLPDWRALPVAVAPFAGKLQGMALGPEGARCPPDVRAALESAGISRVAPFGELQNPPLGWRHEGNPFFPGGSAGGR